MTVLGSEGRIRKGERKAALAEFRSSTYVMPTADAMVSVMAASAVNRVGPCSEKKCSKSTGEARDEPTFT